MTLIAFILIILPIIAFIVYCRKDVCRGVEILSKNDVAHVRYVETHHRWVEFWILLPGWLLAALVLIDDLTYTYAWGFYSPIFHMEYDLPESGATTLYISITYLFLSSIWMILNLNYIRLVNKRLEKEKIK